MIVLNYKWCDKKDTFCKANVTKRKRCWDSQQHRQTSPCCLLVNCLHPATKYWISNENFYEVSDTLLHILLILVQKPYSFSAEFLIQANRDWIIHIVLCKWPWIDDNKTIDCHKYIVYSIYNCGTILWEWCLSRTNAFSKLI